MRPQRRQEPRREGAGRRLPATIGRATRLAGLLCACAVLFSGCASVRFGSVFTQNDGATHTLEMTVPRASMTAQDEARVERQIANAEMNARSGGLSTIRIDNPETVGIRVTSTTQDALDAAAALNGIFNTLGLGSETGPVAPFHGTFERVSEPVGGTSFELDLVVDGQLLYEAAAGVAPGHPQMSSPEGVREVVRIEYRATMPGQITETNGNRRGDSTAAWTIPLQDSTTLLARSNVGKTTPWIWTTLAIAGSLAAVGLSAAIVWSVLHRQQRLGRIRLPLALRVSEEDARRAGLRQGQPLRSFSEVRKTLVGLLRGYLGGERLEGRLVRPPRRHDREETRRHGVDTEGD